MSRTDEVHRITENVYKSIMEQFNPCLRNFIAMGKSYEKALSSVTFAAKGYFDALVRMGEMASESQGSKDIGEVLFQMAEVHRQIQIQLEEMLKSFHNELLTELEKKVELDARYLNTEALKHASEDPQEMESRINTMMEAALKKYQTEHKSKGESLEKCQAELKKLRRKSQGSKHPSKYGDKEMQYVEAISNKQSEMDNYIAEGYKNALSEERRRYCFLVDRQCAVAKSSSVYHGKGKELLSQKVPGWQQACAEPNKLPERAMLLAQQMSGVPGAPGPHSHPHHPGGPHPKGAMAISDPISGAKALPVPPELAALMAGGSMGQQRLMQGGAEGGVAVLNGSAGPHGGGGDYQQWMEAKAAKSSSSQTGTQGYSNTLPVRKGAPAKHKTTLPETRTLPRSSSMAAGLEKNGRTRVQAIFSHAAGDNSTLLSFAAGDVITLLVPEARDGWHYGENEKNRMRGWFPFSYTHLITDRGEEESGPQLRVNNLQHGKSSSTGNLLEREDASLPLPDYSMHSRMAAQNAALVLRQQQQQQQQQQQPQRPYSMMASGYPQQAPEEYEQRFPMSTGPPSEPMVEAPPSPPVDYNADVDDDEDDDVSTGSALYDLVRKSPTPPGLY